jgi:hypothetical protein
MTSRKQLKSQWGNILVLATNVALGSGCGSAAEEPPHDSVSSGERLFNEETFGGNGRTCSTCHTKVNGTLTTAQASQLFDTDPSGALFRSIDSDDGVGDSYLRLSQRATVRINLPIPPNIRLQDEPTATTFTVNRGIPTTMDISLTADLLMADAREANLGAQARGAIDAHYEPKVAVSGADSEAIAAFEATEAFFSSASTALFARGGAPPGLPSGDTEAQRRGRKFFEPGGRCTVCHDGPMLNVTDANNGAFGAGSRVEGNLVSTDAEKLGLMGGNFSTSANVDRPWLIDAAGDGFGGSDDVVMVVPDLGVALISGKVTDALLFKIQTLRGISKTPPYFRDGSAATLEDVMNHYQRFINAVGDICDQTTGECYVTDQDKSDVVEFLQLL